MTARNNIFNGLTQEQAKKLFREKCMILHPDRGGNQSEFIEMKKQYDEYLQNGNYFNANNDIFNGADYSFSYIDFKELVKFALLLMKSYEKNI